MSGRRVEEQCGLDDVHAKGLRAGRRWAHASRAGGMLEGSPKMICFETDMFPASTYWYSNAHTLMGRASLAYVFWHVSAHVVICEYGRRQLGRNLAVTHPKIWSASKKAYA